MLPDSFNDALVECVKACGGSKVVGPALWPTKDVDAAQRHLLACLNPDRSEKLGPEAVMVVLRMARDSGCHVGMQYLCAQLGYTEPKPIEPEDTRAELQREFIESTKRLGKLAERIESIAMPASRGRR